jgi:hypothetical protein
MKVCPQCRADNYNDTKSCHACGAELGMLKEVELTSLKDRPASQADNKFISGPAKVGYWFAAWGCVLLIVLLTSPTYILAAPFFPIGLFALLPQGAEGGVKAWMTGSFIVGWAFYILLSIVMFKIKGRNLFFVIYVIFCGLLVLNLGGCYRTTEAASHIQ